MLSRLRANNLRIVLFEAMASLLAVSQVQATLVDLTPMGGSMNSAASVSLADLVGGAVTGIAVGDKEFTGFSYSLMGDMPNASNVLVLGFQDTSGNWGVSFHGAFLDLPGGGASTAQIGFVVEVAAQQAAQGLRLTDAHLFLGGLGVGEESSFTVDESFAQNNSLLSAYATKIGPGAPQAKNSDSTVFAGVAKLNVAKDIVALAGTGSFLPARASVIDQSFSSSQTSLPELTSIILVGLAGLAGVVANRWRASH
jgi:hypothetical protein